MAVAYRRLRHLGQQRLGVAQQQALHRTGVEELVLQQRPFQPVAVAGALHDRAAGRGFAAHEQGNTDDSLVADDGDFGRSAIRHDVEQGNDGGGGKIDVAHLAAGLIKRLGERHRDQFQIGQDASVLVRRQGGKKVVLAGIMSPAHKISPRYQT